MSHDDDEIITLTPLGVISSDLDKEEARWALDALELYMRRHGVALAVVGTKMEFVNNDEVQPC